MKIAPASEIVAEAEAAESTRISEEQARQDAAKAARPERVTVTPGPMAEITMRLGSWAITYSLLRSLTCRDQIITLTQALAHTLQQIGELQHLVAVEAANGRPTGEGLSWRLAEFESVRDRTCRRIAYFSDLAAKELKAS